ncbi:hypothetical protein TNCV_3077341 [Trichonephila clavipes]|nr:hypothetical protein TNCV_3077341 [Trichonephila clavipes]
MSYDYVACKQSLEYPFGLGALGKIKIPKYNFVSSELRCLPLERQLGIKITCGTWYLRHLQLNPCTPLRTGDVCSCLRQTEEVLEYVICYHRLCCVNVLRKVRSETFAVAP